MIPQGTSMQDENALRHFHIKKRFIAKRGFLPHNQSSYRLFSIILFFQYMSHTPRKEINLTSRVLGTRFPEISVQYHNATINRKI